MAKYRVAFADSFLRDLDKLDKSVQKQIIKWIKKHLQDVDFPTSPGKVLTGQLSGYVRFRVANYRIISHINNEEFILTNLHVGHRSDIYKKVKKIKLKRFE